MILIIDPDQRFREHAESIIGQPCTLMAGLDELTSALTARRDTIDVVIIGPGTNVDRAILLAETLQHEAPEIRVVLVQHALGSDVLHGALRAGVTDVLPANFEPEVLKDAAGRALQLAHALREGGSSRTKDDSRGHIVTVFSPKGGVGKSMVASNLAVILAQRGSRVVAVDLDLQFGDLAIMLQLFPARTIYDAANAVGELDATTALGYCSEHRSGALLLPAPLEPGLAENVPLERVQELFAALRSAGLTVVIDTPPWFTDHVLNAIDACDELVLVATMDVPSIKNLKLALQTLEILGHGREHMRIVLNRADSKVGLTVGDVERALGTGIDLAIPSSREVPLSVNRGTPLAMSAPRSEVTQALIRLASLVGVPTPAAAGGDRKNRFGRRVR